MESFFFDTGENMEDIGENVGYQHIFLFHTIFKSVIQGIVRQMVNASAKSIDLGQPEQST